MQVIINGLKHAKPPVWSFKSHFASLSLLLRSHKYKFLLHVCGLTILRAEKFLIGSSAASETELSMMNTRMRLVNMWWLISLWQNTRNLEDEGNSVSAWCRFMLSALSTTGQCFLRVCAAEDEEGASLWDGSDLLLLDQLGDDRPGPWWNFWILLLRRGLLVVLLLLLQSSRKCVSVFNSSYCKDKWLYDD